MKEGQDLEWKNKCVDFDNFESRTTSPKTSWEGTQIPPPSVIHKVRLLSQGNSDPTGIAPRLKRGYVVLIEIHADPSPPPTVAMDTSKQGINTGEEEYCQQNLTLELFLLLLRVFSLIIVLINPY